MIVIHIGLRKSGSTSLQQFLSANETPLRALGVDYPRLGRAGRLGQVAHTNLRCELRRHRNYDPAAGSMDDVGRYWRASTARTMILSCEGFEACPAEEALRLKDAVRRGDEPFRIVMIVRGLMDLMASSYGQRIKFGVDHYDFDAFFESRMREGRVHYIKVAKQWASVFGWKQMRIRALEDPNLANGDLIDEFLTLAGVDPATEAARRFQRPGVANARPGWKILEATRALYDGRHGLPAAHPLASATTYGRDQRQDLGLRAIDIGERRGWNADRGLYFTRAQAQRCLDVYRRSIEALNRRPIDPLPLPLDLDAAGFRARDRLPDVSDIPAADLRAFYDEVAAAAAIPSSA